MAAEDSRYRFRVDADDVIVWLGERWLAFAKENGAAELTKTSVLGRSLWEFVAGEETRNLYRRIHARVRLRGKPAIVNFRCDSPSLQRHMRMTILRGSDGHLKYDSLLVRAVPQTYLALLDSRRARSESMLTMCSCCKRALLESVGWLDAAEVALRLGLLESQKDPELRHTICPECAQTLRDAANNGSAA